MVALVRAARGSETEGEVKVEMGRDDDGVAHELVLEMYRREWELHARRTVFAIAGCYRSS